MLFFVYVNEFVYLGLVPGLVLGLCWACAGLVGLCARKPVPRSTSAGTLGAFGASRSAPLGALPFGPCVPWALRPFLRTPAERVRRTSPGSAATVEMIRYEETSAK